MILSDGDIKAALTSGAIVIDPLNWSNIQPASVDLHLGDLFRVLRPSPNATDSRYPGMAATDLITATGRPYILRPGTLVLGTTVERVEIGDLHVGRLEGRSSLGRIGLVIHSTAGYVDPGWRGELTLELSNLSDVPIALWPGTKICQITFEEMRSRVERPYGSPGLGSHYQGQQGPTAAK